MTDCLSNLHRAALGLLQPRKPAPLTREALYETWAALHETQEGSPAEEAAYNALTTADVERRGRPQ